MSLQSIVEETPAPQHTAFFPSQPPSPSPQPLLVSRRYLRAGGPLDFACGTDVKDWITVLARHLRERGPALRAAIREEPELDYVHDAGEESEHTEEDEERRPIVYDAVLSEVRRPEGEPAHAKYRPAHQQEDSLHLFHWSMVVASLHPQRLVTWIIGISAYLVIIAIPEP